MWYLSSNPTTILCCISTVLVIIFTIFIFTTRKKIVFSFFIHANKAYGGWELSIPHLGHFTLCRTDPPPPTNIRLVPQDQSGHFGDEKYIWILLGTEPQFFGCPVLSLLTVLNMLSCILAQVMLPSAHEAVSIPCGVRYKP
jgi:hypothetical protein